MSTMSTAAANHKLNQEKFKIAVRFLMKAASEKRCVSYLEFESILGIDRNRVGIYLGAVNVFCKATRIPTLNMLVIESDTCQPNYQVDSEYKSWGEAVAACWRKYNTSVERQKAGIFSEVENSLSRYIRLDSRFSGRSGFE